MKICIIEGHIKLYNVSPALINELKEDRIPYKNFGYYKYKKNKVKNIIVYNRRISYGK